MNRVRDGSVIGGRRCGLHMGDEMRCLWITGFGEMEDVTWPHDLTLDAEASLRIVRGVDEQGSRRQITLLAPAHRFLFGGVVLLDPHLPKNLNQWNLAEPVRGIGVVNGR